MNIAVVDDNLTFAQDFCNTIKELCQKHKIDCKISSKDNGTLITERYNKYNYTSTKFTRKQVKFTTSNIFKIKLL